MIIVPVVGDVIKTSKGLPMKVLSYTNYKSEGPAVSVEAVVGGTVDTEFFADIVTVNDQKVTFIRNDKGFKVLDTTGYLKRKYALPQPGEFLTSDAIVENRKYEVQRIRLHVPNELSRGMILDVSSKDEPGVIEITLDQITDIDHYLFNRDRFLEYYNDYREKGKT